MKAVGFMEFGGPDVLGVHYLADPHPGNGEVRIRVRAAAVNPTDISCRTGLFSTDGHQPPHILGTDAAGVIDELGPGSTWQVGDQVMALAIPLSEHGGAYAEYLIAPDDSIARIPANTSLEQAATLPMNGLTAAQILDVIALRPGQSLAVTGAAGMVGNYLVQLAKKQGLIVIADADAQDRALVQSLGPDHIIDRGSDFAARIHAILPDGVDALADTALLHQKVVPALRDGGVFASLRRWEGEPIRGIRYKAIWVYDDYHSQTKLDSLRQAVEDGALTPRLADVLPAENAAQAHRRIEAGGSRGRTVLAF